jgi:polyhydroxyalkanoate synthesis regulator phasin
MNSVFTLANSLFRRVPGTTADLPCTYRLRLVILGDMKSIVMKSIYAGLGLLGTGKETVEELGRKLAKQADISEKDGEKIARHLQSQSKKAVDFVHKTMETEVNRVVDALHAATRELTPTSHKSKPGPKKSRSTAKKPKAQHHKAKRHPAA